MLHKLCNKIVLSLVLQCKIFTNTYLSKTYMLLLWTFFSLLKLKTCDWIYCRNVRLTDVDIANIFISMGPHFNGRPVSPQRKDPKEAFSRMLKLQRFLGLGSWPILLALQQRAVHFSHWAAEV